MTTKPRQFSTDIDQVRQPLEAWRKIRRHRDPIPEPLWKAMAKLGRIYGVSAVSAALRVEYYALKDRVTALQKPRTSWSPKQPPFIELKPLPTCPPTVGVVEVEDDRGGKMTLRLDSSLGVKALDLIEAFWRRKP